MNRIDNIFTKNKSVKNFAKQYLEYVSDVINNISLEEIESFINVLINARESGAAIYFIGNGGSAATASHFANDIAIGTKSSEKPFRAQSLCDNQAIITAIANDDGYENIFSYQLKVLLNKGDIVVAISASGNSPNLLSAINFAKQKGAFTVGLTAFDGGLLRKATDISVHVPTQLKEYGPAEDGHMVLDHLISKYLMRYNREQSK